MFTIPDFTDKRTCQHELKVKQNPLENMFIYLSPLILTY